MKKTAMLLAAFVFGVTLLNAQTTSSPAAPTATVQANPNAPEAEFEKEVIDYGTIEYNSNGEREFKFKNTGKEPLIISNCQASCGCTTPACPKEPIGPGSSGVIKVKYDSNRVGVFTKTVTVTSNAKTPSVTLMIKGTIEATPVEEAFPGKGNSGMKQ